MESKEGQPPASGMPPPGYPQPGTEYPPPGMPPPGMPPPGYPPQGPPGHGYAAAPAQGVAAAQGVAVVGTAAYPPPGHITHAPQAYPTQYMHPGHMQPMPMQMPPCQHQWREGNSTVLSWIIAIGLCALCVPCGFIAPLVMKTRICTKCNLEVGN
eukprot:TRINITY_DN16068_c0_g1_i2.p1 TRINITY_DN16068_c0_g1~~TRINITY_DN16068_c0_g1_i2.p1  ORF type:complete len:155 (+),score=12.68 TRINITY_DN16068_c0_g1_i2:205-669(+)